jgi:hypothetical protein
VPKEKGTVMVMTLLEGGTSSRQKAWLKVWIFCTPVSILNASSNLCLLAAFFSNAGCYARRSHLKLLLARWNALLA